MQQKLTVEDVMQLGAELRRRAIASATLEERLAGLTPEERSAGLTLEDRLAGLTSEELMALLQQLQARLAQQVPDKPGHRTRRT